MFFRGVQTTNQVKSWENLCVFPGPLSIPLAIGPTLVLTSMVGDSIQVLAIFGNWHFYNSQSSPTPEEFMMVNIHMRWPLIVWMFGALAMNIIVN